MAQDCSPVYKKSSKFMTGVYNIFNLNNTTNLAYFFNFKVISLVKKGSSLGQKQNQLI